MISHFVLMRVPHEILVQSTYFNYSASAFIGRRGEAGGSPKRASQPGDGRNNKLY